MDPLEKHKKHLPIYNSNVDREINMTVNMTVNKQKSETSSHKQLNKKNTRQSCGHLVNGVRDRFRSSRGWNAGTRGTLSEALVLEEAV